MQEKKPSAAVAVADPKAPAVVQHLDFTPGNVTQAYRLAKMLSESGLVPSALKNKPSDVLVVLMSGRELGMPPMQSLRTLHVIEGRIQMAAEMMVARCKVHRDICQWFRLVESTEKQATYETLRVGDPDSTTYTYSIDDAAKAGLLQKDNWKKQTRAMLRARASSGLCRIVYPDLVSGIVIPDEADEIRASAAAMARMQASAVEDAIDARVNALPALPPGDGSDPTEGAADPDRIPAHDPETGEIVEEETAVEDVAPRQQPQPAKGNGSALEL